MTEPKGLSAPIDPAEFDGLRLSDAINRIYDREVDCHLQLHYDGLSQAAKDGLVPPLVSSAIESVPAETFADFELDNEAIAEIWLKCAAMDPDQLSHAKGRARLALQPGFWRSIRSHDFAIEPEAVDPFSHYSIPKAAWDEIATAYLSLIEAKLRARRNTWLVLAVGTLLNAIQNSGLYHLSGLDEARPFESDQSLTVVGRGLSPRDCQAWTLLRVPSVLTVERFNGAVQTFRAVTIRRDDRAVAGVPGTHSAVKVKRKRGRSFREQDRPWIEAMHGMRGSAKDALDAARAVVDLIFDGQTVQGIGNGESKVRRLRDRYVKAHGDWGPDNESV